MGRKATDKSRGSNIEKKKKWIRNAMPYFQEFGIREISMDKMAEYIGVSKGTIYNHFSSKEEIVEFAVQVKVDSIKDFYKILFDEKLGFIERYYKAMGYYSQQMYDISMRIIKDLQELYPSVWLYIQKFQKVAFNGLVKYYEEGMIKGYFEKVNPVLLAMEDRMFFELLFDQGFLNRTNLTIRKAFNQHFQVRFNGLISSKIPFELD